MADSNARIAHREKVPISVQDYYSVDEVAALLRISRSRVHELAKECEDPLSLRCCGRRGLRGRERVREPRARGRGGGRARGGGAHARDRGQDRGVRARRPALRRLPRPRGRGARGIPRHRRRGAVLHREGRRGRGAHRGVRRGQPGQARRPRAREGLRRRSLLHGGRAVPHHQRDHRGVPRRRDRRQRLRQHGGLVEPAHRLDQRQRPGGRGLLGHLVGVWFGASGPDDSKGALPYDTYEIEELLCEANGGKQLLGPIEVRVYRDAVTVDLGTLTNDDLPRTVLSKKSVTGEDELPGATLRVYDADGELAEEWVSGEEPHELTLLPGTYTLHEELAPEGYLVASDVKFKVAEGVPVTQVEMVDDCTRVDAEKVDAATGEPLAGATMQVVNAEGEVVEEWVSDEGPHRIEALVPGEYVLRETEAPEGYELAEDVPFVVEETADVQAATIADKALPGTAPGTTPGGLPQTGD